MIEGPLRTVVDNLLEGCQIIGFDWTYLYVNRVASHHWRRGRDELVGRKVMECYRGIDATALFHALRRCMVERSRHQMEEEVPFPDGSTAWFDLRILPVDAGLAVLSVDVTEQKRMASAVKAGEQRFRDLYEATPDGVLVVTRGGRIALANPAALRMFGFDELVGVAVEELLPVSMRAAHAGHRERYLEDRRSRSMAAGRDLAARRRDGTEFPVDISLATLSFHGEPAALAIVRDIAERHALEAARELADAGRRRSDQDLRLMIDGVAEYALFGLDPEGRVSAWNEGGRRLFGYTVEEAVGLDCEQLCRPEPGQAEGLLGQARSRGRAEREGWVSRRDGTRFWASLVVSSLADLGGRIGFAAVARDLTERRKLEEQVRQAQKLEAIGKLAGGVAHDFNNLLSVILSYSTLLVADLRPDDPMREDLLQIEAAGRRAGDLTRQLLAFGRQQILDPSPIDLNGVVGATERMLRRLIGEDIELTFLPGSGLGVTELDPSQVDQILVNLVVNARDAMPDGGKLTIETANVELDQEYADQHVGVVPGPYVMLAISDTGEGMDAATRARIFEPFFTTKARGKGTGLGLATVFGIVRQSGGYVWVYSEVGRGTTFRIYFPRSDRSPAPPPGARATPLRRGGTEAILLVEDDEGVRSLARDILARLGYEVLEAGNGEEATLRVEGRAGPIDLLLTDVVMPRMSGRQLAERLTTLRPSLRVLYMSGYTDNSIVHHGVLEAGVKFLQKPITPDSLARKVREVLDEPAQSTTNR